MRFKWGIFIFFLIIFAYLIFSGYIYLLLEIPLKVKSPSPENIKKTHYTHLIVLSGGCRGYRLLGISSEKRLESAVELYKKGVKIILAGEFSCGRGQRIGYHFLISKGIPEEDIIELKTSRSTIEDCKRAASYLKKEKIKKPVLITSFYHAKRVKLIFSQFFGKNFILYSSNIFREKFDNMTQRRRLARLLLHEYGGFIYWYLQKFGIYNKSKESRGYR